MFSTLLLRLPFRAIINGGYLILGILMIAVVIFDYYDMVSYLIVTMSLFTAVFQATQGTYTWVYVGQIACQESLSVATFVIWLGVLILSIWTDNMFAAMTSEGVFGFFAATCLISYGAF